MNHARKPPLQTSKKVLIEEQVNNDKNYCHLTRDGIFYAICLREACLLIHEDFNSRAISVLSFSLHAGLVGSQIVMKL